MRKKRPVLTRLHHYFFPHKKNGYKPHVFRVASVACILLAVIVLEGAYLAQVKLVFPHTNFLSAVLPGALLTLTNDDRAANGVSAVSENDRLAEAAQDVANDMAAKGYFAHVSPDGKDPWYWLNMVGYKYQYAGENLAVNFTDSESVETAWMNSPTHRANIVKPQYTQIGVGVANGIYQGREATFVVQFFASPSVASRPQEVAAVASALNVAEAAPAAIVSTSTSTTSPTVQVLGTQIQMPPTPPIVSLITAKAASLFALVATSPAFSTGFTLSTLMYVILVLFIIAIVVKIGVQFVEVIVGGLLLLIVILGLLYFNGTSMPKIQLPFDLHPAATSSSP